MRRRCSCSSQAPSHSSEPPVRAIPGVTAVVTLTKRAKPPRTVRTSNYSNNTLTGAPRSLEANLAPRYSSMSLSWPSKYMSSPPAAAPTTAPIIRVDTSSITPHLQRTFSMSSSPARASLTLGPGQSGVHLREPVCRFPRRRPLLGSS